MPYSTINLYKENTSREKFVIVYYRHEGEALRHRTGITVNVKNWDKKADLVKTSDSSADSKNDIIKQAHALVEQIIEEFVNENGIKPTSLYVKQQLQSGRKLKKEKLGANMLDCYSDFLALKKIELSSPERSEKSIKDYISTQNALIDYSQIVGNIIPANINEIAWLNNFNRFLYNARPVIKGYDFKTKKQNDKTRDKRFSVLKTFGNWLLKQKYISDIEVLTDYRIKVEGKNYYALKLPEIKVLQEKEFKISSHQKAIDMFIVACHTGVRYSDAIRIKKAFIHKHDGVQLLILNNQKTKETIEVPLTKKVLEILEKYNYHLDLMTGQKLNTYLHEALATMDEFKTEVESNGDLVPKFKAITFHTGRRTFITNLVNNNINLNAIMTMTGHKKISTLQQYIDTDYKLVLEHVKIFNEL